MLRFTLLATLLGVLIFACLQVGVTWGWFGQPSYAVRIVLFFLLAHVGLFSFVVRLLSERPENFVRIYLGVTILRILFFGMFIFAIIWLDSEGATRNAAFFLISYFLFTALEVGALLRQINAQKPAKTGQKEG